MVLLFFLGAAASQDRKTGLIPDFISYGGILGGLLLSLCHGAEQFFPAVQNLLLVSGGMLWVAMIFESLAGKEGIGFGDIKLSGVLAVFLGVRGSVLVIACASWMALLHASCTGKFSRSRRIPFAPFIFLGALFHCGWHLFTGR
jgi:leader peptidase (prepilin peptidase)/N-methyltransferase